MRRRMDRALLEELMRELARSVRGRGPFRVLLLGGGTAVLAGWRESTIDADLHVEEDAVLSHLAGIKDRLQVNIELVRPEHFVPALEGCEDRHVFVERIGDVSFHHYDPYSQLLSKLVRGFQRDMHDAKSLVRSGMVDFDRFRELVQRIPEASFARYPALSRAAVADAVEAFSAAFGAGVD